MSKALPIELVITDALGETVSRYATETDARRAVVAKRQRGIHGVIRDAAGEILATF